MAISVSLAVIPAAPAHGATVTATYTVTGNDGTPGGTVPVTGSVTVGTQLFQVSASVTTPGTPALPVTYTVPQCAGLTFTGTSNPAVFTAVVP